MLDDDTTKTDDTTEAADEAATEPEAEAGEKPEEAAEEVTAEPEAESETETQPEEAAAEEPAQDAAPEAQSAGTDQHGRTLYTVKCSNCGKETQVPFQPSGGRPVYCRDCYMQKKNA